MVRKKEILLLSGGLDSFIAWHYLGKPQTLYADMGHRYAEKEKKVIRRLNELCPEMNTIIDNSMRLGDFEETIEDNGYIPLRNVSLAILGSQYAETVYIIGINGDRVEDKNEKAFELMSCSLTQLGKDTVKVKSPFWDMSKGEIVKWYKENVGDIDTLLETVSCYSVTDKPCGVCGSCFRRWVALEVNGIEEDYINAPWNSDYAKDVVNNLDRYSEKRRRETIKAIEKKKSVG